MKFNIPVEETIKKRSSVRTYEERSLSATDKEKLMQFADNLSNPFGEKVKFHFIEKSTDGNGEKLGTYGVIKGATSFIGVSVSDTEFGLEAVGYEFENLILYATHMGLGTVWLAGTFNRKQFLSSMDIKDDELFPAISPVGYPLEKQRFIEAVMKKLVKSDQRNPWHMLFFKNDFSTPLTQKEAGIYAIPLEMLRLAPSAINAQPWRIVKEGDVFHFYETHSAKTKENEKSMKRIDLGIGISHFHQASLERGLSGRFEKRSQQKIQIPPNTKYIISWVCEKE